MTEKERALEIRRIASENKETASLLRSDSNSQSASAADTTDIQTTSGQRIPTKKRIQATRRGFKSNGKVSPEMPDDDTPEFMNEAREEIERRQMKRPNDRVIELVQRHMGAEAPQEIPFARAPRSRSPISKKESVTNMEESKVKTEVPVKQEKERPCKELFVLAHGTRHVHDEEDDGICAWLLLHLVVTIHKIIFMERETFTFLCNFRIKSSCLHSLNSSNGGFLSI